MRRKKEIHLIKFNHKTAFFSALFMNLFFIFVHLIIFVYSFYMGENVGDFISERITELFFLHSLVTFFVDLFMLYFFFRIEFWIIGHFSNNRKRLWIVFFFLLIFVAVLSTLISQLLAIWFKDTLTAYSFSVIHFIKDLTLFFSSVLVTYLIYMVIKNQEKMVENQNLMVENLKNRYNVLKNQTDPHFLFNSLNSLNGLIGYDDERAHEYLLQLSSVFRYTMQERMVVTLSDEMEFAESYIYLMQIRYGKAFSVDIQIPEGKRSYFVLPFAIQTLVENAVKHNIVSMQKPLEMVIRITENETVIVENNIQLKQDALYGNGLGLSNLNERYWLMFKENINIKVNDSVFSVEIPLIKKMDKFNDKFHVQVKTIV